jgi:acylglycerol lipase
MRALALVLLLAACAPVFQSPGPAVMAPRFDDDAFVAEDGARLPLRRWMPEASPRAVVLALHGFNDYSNAFDDTAKYLARQGIATYAYDQRGFGANPKAGHWVGHAVLVRDFEAAVAALRAKHPKTPVLVLGESMGAAVALTAMGNGSAAGVDGAMLVAPAVWGRETMDVFKRTALWFTARLTPDWTFTGRGLDITPSDNKEMLRALSRDPLVIKKTRADAIWGVVNLMDDALDAAPQVRTPLLILYGEKDEIIPKEPTRLLLERLPRNGATTVAVYENGYHMLTRDLQAETVWKDVAAWIGARASKTKTKLPSGADGRKWGALGPPPPPEPRGERP